MADLLLHTSYGANGKYDYTKDAFTEKKHATAFATFLAAEFQINVKGVAVERDGPGCFRLRIPLIATYWQPNQPNTNGNDDTMWRFHFEDLKTKVGQWASA